MPNLTMELAHLALADRHIAQVKVNIAASRTRIAESGDPASAIAISYLATFEETLAAFESHRELILQAIQDVREEWAELAQPAAGGHRIG